MAENGVNEEGKQPEVTAEALQKQIKELQELLEKQKKATSAAASDAANWKKQVRDAQDEATRKEAEREEAFADMQKRLADYEKRDKITSNKASLLAIGYPEDLAEKKASFLYEGDFAKANEVERDFLVWRDKENKAAQQRKMGNPDSGTAFKPTVTKEQFKKMGIAERSKLLAEQPDLYAELTKN